MARQHPRTIAYLRVSTHEQDVAKNQTDILLLAHRKQLGQVQFVEETVSGRVPWRRRKIAQVLDTLEAGDTLVVSELSRLGRSMLEWASITASATFGHSASPDNGTCWHILALPGAIQVYVKYFGNFCHHNPLYSHHLQTHFYFNGLQE